MAKDTSNLKLTKLVNQSQILNSKMDDISKKLDILLVIQLAKCGMTRVEAAKVLGVSEDTIERMLPFGKIKANLGKEVNV
jgi:hypothetical protein